VFSDGTMLRGSFGKTEIGALIAGKTNKATLASPARVNFKPTLLSVMLFSFHRFNVS
jgi:hypothetical protein